MVTSLLSRDRGTLHIPPYGQLGLLLRLPFLDSPPDSQCFEDQISWEVRHGYGP